MSQTTKTFLNQLRIAAENAASTAATAKTLSENFTTTAEAHPLLNSLNVVAGCYAVIEEQARLAQATIVQAIDRVEFMLPVDDE